MSESLQRALYSVLELFLFLFLVAAGIHFTNQTPLSDITKAYLEKACVNGGFSESLINNMSDELSLNGFDTNYIEITVTPSKALYSTDTEYVKRNEIISIDINYKKLGLIDTLFKKLGATTDTKNHSHRYGMSEKY